MMSSWTSQNIGRLVELKSSLCGEELKAFKDDKNLIQTRKTAKYSFFKAVWDRIQ